MYVISNLRLGLYGIGPLTVKSCLPLVSESPPVYLAEITSRSMLQTYQMWVLPVLCLSFHIFLLIYHILYCWHHITGIVISQTYLSFHNFLTCKNTTADAAEGASPALPTESQVSSLHCVTIFCLIQKKMLTILVVSSMISRKTFVVSHSLFWLHMTWKDSASKMPPLVVGASFGTNRTTSYEFAHNVMVNKGRIWHALFGHPEGCVLFGH